MKIIVEKKNIIYIYIKKKITIVNNNIAIRIAGKVSRYIDASMNRATPKNDYFLNVCKYEYNYSQN